ncbi:uncharacterized protein LOC100679685 isoform X1 [Nasonia vitripennis]|uniref:Uncharacterized protein n=1 Tax=Nasonia vitripennis TaxID=7425 RepID=A0A7M7GFL1_NASVI|nr:uncharacterized protein LOC100679685 isoform X1 [Nasonia vitripennis]
MANCLVTSSETLAKIALEVAEQLVLERLENIIPSKIYEKIDFNILEQEVFFNIQVTKCRLGCPDLKPLLSFVLKPYLKAHKVNSNTVVAIVQKKWEDDVQVQKVLYSKKRLSLIDDPNLVDVQKELSSSKDYTSIKILFRVENTSLSSFYDIMLAYIMQIESYDPNIKFLFRKGSEYIYRNQVWMDDVVLSCKIFSSACAKIIKNSNNDRFRKDMMTLLGARKSTGVEAALGCKLIAKANNQFKVPIKNSKTEKQDSMDVDSQIESDTMDIV